MKNITTFLKVKQYIEEGYQWVVDLDIEGFLII